MCNDLGFGFHHHPDVWPSFTPQCDIQHYFNKDFSAIEDTEKEKLETEGCMILRAVQHQWWYSFTLWTQKECKECKLVDVLPPSLEHSSAFVHMLKKCGQNRERWQKGINYLDECNSAPVAPVCHKLCQSTLQKTISNQTDIAITDNMEEAGTEAGIINFML